MYALELSNITFRRENRSILSGISWRVIAGQHWGLLGANGSGKTTLLKVVTGYEWPTSGEVSVLGRRFGSCNIRELRKIIGWVSSGLEHRLPPEDLALEIVLSGYEASLGLYRVFDEREVDRAREALRSVAAEHVADRPFGLLSQGEQQRVLIARALVSQPSLLILDEPCSGLDPAARARFLADLQALAIQDHAPTFIFVTHHVEEIGPWITRVLILKEGGVLAEGTPAEALSATNMEHAFGAPCTVVHMDGQFWLRVKT